MTRPGAKVLGEEDVPLMGPPVGVGVEPGQEGEGLRTEAGLLREFPESGLAGGLPRIDPSPGKFEEP